MGSENLAEIFEQMPVDALQDEELRVHQEIQRLTDRSRLIIAALVKRDAL